MTTASTTTTNEAQIRQLIAEQQRAICAKDVDQIMSHYATEVIRPSRYANMDARHHCLPEKPG